MSARVWPGVAVLVASVTVPAVARADMVSGGDCLALATACTCDDAEYMSTYLANQEAALAAWQDTQSDIFGGAAKSFDDARALFNSKFTGDPAVLARFSSCPNLDPKKIAGNSILGGGAEIDDCFCMNACSDIVQATIAHERTHVAFNILGIAYIIGVGSACKLDLTDQDFCSVSDALLLSESEIRAHEAGNQVLSDAIDNLKDPNSPDMACTWDPLPPSSPREIPPPPQPAGFFARARTLFTRFVGGTPAARP